MAKWNDLYKLFSFSFEDDPLGKQTKQTTGAGVSQHDAVPSLRDDGAMGGRSGGQIRLRDTNDFIDLSTVSNRQTRYKEYDRLRTVPEIEAAMTVFADEACIGGGSRIATVVNGFRSIKQLTEEYTGEPFMVYCWDFKKEDYTIGWAHNPRIVKKAKTIKIGLDNGKSIIVTEDHRILLKNGEWIEAGKLKRDDVLMPFYKAEANPGVNSGKATQYPRIFTFSYGWVPERQFIDDWNGKKNKHFEKYKKIGKMIASELQLRKIRDLADIDLRTIDQIIKNIGFTPKELRSLKEKEKERRVLYVLPHQEIDVYDLSVVEHENFCGDSVIYHNCQSGDNGHIIDIEIKDSDIKKELEHLFFHRKMLNMDYRAHKDFKKMCIKGDLFYELIVDADDPKSGILKIAELPPESMFRIETTKGKLIEFQQAKEGPDYEALTRAPIAQATDMDIMQSKATRFDPHQIVHIKIGDDRELFYPYGQSLIETARGPAHQLKLMEDAMVVYRLSRAPERRVFYIDVHNLPPYKAEAFVDRMKDQLRKKKISTNIGKNASGVEEKWHMPAFDEDFWIPIRPNSNTRIDTLPGAQNLGEIDDSIYFRNKLYTALMFPKNYLSNEDVQVTRMTLSAQDIKFAKLVERLQRQFVEGLWQIADRHLKLRGFPEETYEDLVIRMTAPSDWKELTRAEVITNRLNNAGTLQSSQLMSQFDILTKYMKVSEDEAKHMLSRLKVQKLEDLKLQVLAQNPALLGVGVPSQDETELGAEPGGPNPMLAPPETEQPSSVEEPQATQQSPEANSVNGVALPEPTAGELKQYDLQIQTYSSEMDKEEPDFSET